MEPFISKDPLHGLTLETILKTLVEKLGWNEMSGRIRVHCLKRDPSISSSLKFFRKTPWARKKIEDLYLTEIAKKPGNP